MAERTKVVKVQLLSEEAKKLLADALIEGEDRDKNLISKLSADDIKALLSTNNEKE